ncbi:MAG: CoA-binding protein [Flavobacteriales bacterium]|jgi:predicted CoA-binding protein|nr:CoA-binding protein [Flavobacteriales bacterium]
MKVLVLGASEKTNRYSNIAINMLRDYEHEVLAIGRREGMVRDVPIITEQETFENVHTITLYLSPANQLPFYDYILSLNPSRIIFNPGTENPELMELLKEKGIGFEIACTLVMLRSNQFNA